MPQGMIGQVFSGVESSQARYAGASAGGVGLRSRSRNSQRSLVGTRRRASQQQVSQQEGGAEDEYVILWPDVFVPAGDSIAVEVVEPDGCSADGLKHGQSLVECGHCSRTGRFPLVSKDTSRAFDGIHGRLPGKKFASPAVTVVRPWQTEFNRGSCLGTPVGNSFG